ncbi:MAG: bifunctional demethylmenaquinone methyltransferase/2-methoxy-6-polyprenyl-1,4-benzoquinol methylase UbiE [Kiritimatiellae bacterium]|nr:bifunctional demethylmenaquinone methyltransferase/2-methoxy-6-polyprenyl-1,4-benzoquinol methylase UbiE [Kiritimatiellia bacterium]
MTNSNNTAESEAGSTAAAQDEPSRDAVWEMFDKIAPRYDMLNRLLSLRRDVAWRKRMATFLQNRSAVRLLDLATGTGDQILHFMDGGADIASAVGMDMSEQMLAVGRKKMTKRGLQDKVELSCGDAVEVPVDSDAFDATSISFGIRNVVDVSRALGEMRRALKPGGCALILEFSMPENSTLRSVYTFYLRHILPIVGGLISGDMYAYRYLNKTIETFPYGDAFCELMRDAGFENTSATPLTFGVASIYYGEKPGA